MCIMSETTPQQRLPWENRWNPPAMEDLIRPIQDQSRKALSTLMDQIDGLEGLEHRLHWYGPSWRWTIEYRMGELSKSKAEEPEAVCYLVPNAERPIVCVPLTNAVVEKLPMRRLNKLVRNGIRSAKCAVSVHWATWNLTASAEVPHLFDLIKRKRKLLAAAEEANA